MVQKVGVFRWEKSTSIILFTIQLSWKPILNHEQIFGMLVYSNVIFIQAPIYLDVQATTVIKMVNLSETVTMLILVYLIYSSYIDMIQRRSLAWILTCLTCRPFFEQVNFGMEKPLHYTEITYVRYTNSPQKAKFS